MSRRGTRRCAPTQVTCARRRSSASTRPPTVGEVEGGYALLLDGRGARTPAKNQLIAPTRAIAEAIAAEWAGQGAVVDPTSMPVTRLANSALDGVAKTLAETRADIARYAGADLLCYRAEEPEALVALQAEAFDPVLAWAEEALGARFILSAGVMHVAQPERALAAVRAAVEAYDEPVRGRRAARPDEPLRLRAARAGGRARRAERRGRLARRPCRRGFPDPANGARTTRRWRAARRGGAISRRRRVVGGLQTLRR